MEIKDILTRLKNLETIVIEYRDNQFGDPIPTLQLNFNFGSWEITELACSNSANVGMGVCQCITHSTYRTVKIGRKDALNLIRRYINDRRMDDNLGRKEIQWLDEIIKSLDTPKS